LIDDSFPEGPEIFGFAITSVSPDTNLGFQRTAVVRIDDNETPGGSGANPEPPPTIQVTTEQVLTGLDRPTAFDWVPGSSSTMVVAEQAGQIKVFGPGTTSYTLLDLRPVVNDQQDRGLLDIELHPNFSTQPYLYAYYAVDPPETANYAAGAYQGPDGAGNRYVHLVRYTVNRDATGRLSVNPATKEILLGGAGDSLNDISGGEPSTAPTSSVSPPPVSSMGVTSKTTSPPIAGPMQPAAWNLDAMVCFM
jgi:glucose/arabinose dehydrogenase